MKVDVKLFAGAKQAAGRASIELDLADGATIADLRRALGREFTALEPVVRRAMFSINLEYATDATIIPSDAEVACIPPVSGG